MSLAAVERTVGKRLGEGAKPIGAAAVSVLRLYMGRQFDEEVHWSGETRSAWKPSQRVIRGLGGSPRTMDDTGQYRAAWEGLGVGGRSAVRENSVEVGVDAARFPRVRLFQGPRTIRGVAPRPVGLPGPAVRDVARIWERYAATGEAPKAEAA